MKIWYAICDFFLWIGRLLTVHCQEIHEYPSDGEALRQDWIKVGNDMRKVMGLPLYKD